MNTENKTIKRAAKNPFEHTDDLPADMRDMFHLQMEKGGAGFSHIMRMLSDAVYDKYIIPGSVMFDTLSEKKKKAWLRWLMQMNEFFRKLYKKIQMVGDYLNATKQEFDNIMDDLEKDGVLDGLNDEDADELRALRGDIHKKLDKSEETIIAHKQRLVDDPPPNHSEMEIIEKNVEAEAHNISKTRLSMHQRLANFFKNRRAARVAAAEAAAQAEAEAATATAAATAAQNRQSHTEEREPYTPQQSEEYVSRYGGRSRDRGEREFDDEYEEVTIITPEGEIKVKRPKKKQPGQSKNTDPDVV